MKVDEVVFRYKKTWGRSWKKILDAKSKELRFLTYKALSGTRTTEEDAEAQQLHEEIYVVPRNY